MMKHTDRWTAQKIARRIDLIKPLVYRRRKPLASFCYLRLSDSDSEPPVAPDIDDKDWPLIEPETYWGRWQSDYLLRTTFRVPTDWNSAAPVALFLPLGEAGDFSHPEALVYVDGSAYAACDRHHQEILLPDRWRDGEEHQLALHVWTGLGGWPETEPGSQLLMHPCALVQVDQSTRDFLAASRVALGVAEHLGEDRPAKGHLLTTLDQAFKRLDTREPFGDRFYASVSSAHAALRAGVEKAGPPLDVDLCCTGHAHIDVAWLWTLGQTRRKVRRTFHTVLRLMEQFPEFHFTQSQPQLYDFVRQDDPDLFAAIQQRVEQGRWEPIGGMWVEADCNLSGPESLARQFLLGRAFFREQFGAEAESPVLWLPDVFGFDWALPQLIKQAGLDYFMTIKLGWNQYNRLPYDSFWWQGLDGTKVLTHFSTTPGPSDFGVSTYNATATPEQAIGAWESFQQKELAQDLLMIYGHGDGGGGPTREMIENIREMERFPAAPRLRQVGVNEFFTRLEESVGDLLPTWNGELYFELHRGTYTTQSRGKRANRKSEFLLHDAEFLSVVAVLSNPNYQVPAETLRRAWKLVLLNQFHDILPGTGINAVHAEALEQYQEVKQICLQVRAAALAAINESIGAEILIINPTSFERHDLAFWPHHVEAGKRLQQSSGDPVLIQETEQGTWIAAGELAPFSAKALIVAAGQSSVPETSLTATPNLLENQSLRVEFDQAGDITRIFDKTTRRDVLPPEAVANQFQAFEDRPLNWDAWDVDIFYDDKIWLADPATSVQVVESGPLRATLEIRRRILHSDYVQRISLAYNSPRLDFDTWIDWRERHILLKVAFPVDVFSPVATYEIQWGNIERPTHRKTSWDWARFETYAQKWVDLSEGGYGVSLINDCKYGHDIRDNIIRLSLLRSPTRPDPEADQGEHQFSYSLFAHAGSWDESTVAEAYAFNDPLIVWNESSPSLERDHSSLTVSAQDVSRLDSPFISVDQPHIVVETVKWAEDGDGVIVRMYESQRKRGMIILSTSFDLAEAWQTNLLEENQAALPVDQNTVRLFVKPYQIVTLRLMPG